MCYRIALNVGLSTDPDVSQQLQCLDRNLQSHVHVRSVSASLPALNENSQQQAALSAEITENTTHGSGLNINQNGLHPSLDRLRSQLKELSKNSKLLARELESLKGAFTVLISELKKSLAYKDVLQLYWDLWNQICRKLKRPVARFCKLDKSKISWDWSRIMRYDTLAKEIRKVTVGVLCAAGVDSPRVRQMILSRRMRDRKRWKALQDRTVIMR